MYYVTQAANAEPYIRKLLETKARLVDGILTGVVMEPTITLVTIQNPGEDSVIINPFGVETPESVIEKYGDQIKHGAFVSLIDRDTNSNTVGGLILVADREADDILYLQNNEYMSDDNAADVDQIGAVIASGDVALAEELETFTVVGNNDDGEAFVAVVTATEDTVYNVGVQAGLVDEGFENSVTIDLIVKGAHPDLEQVAV
jgi:hypothetical protein